MRKMIVVLMLGALILPSRGFTLGLGEIEVKSALNQQLDARIELLSAGPEDAEALIVALASREEFARAGMDRPYELNDIKFKSYVEDDRVFIKVTSGKPIREPFLNILIEVDWPKGHLLREYTILLDPPVFMGGGQPASSGSSRPSMQDSGGATPERFSVPDQSSNMASPYRGNVQVATVVPAPIPPEYRPEPEPATAYDASPEPEPAYADEPVPEAIWLAQQQSQPPTETQVQATQQASGTQLAQNEQTSSQPSAGKSRDWKPDKDYRIKAGDTAWSLAKRMRPDESVSIQQMMLAMLRTNPEIFINGNVNGLKRGFILRMPSRDEMDRVSVKEARTIASEHNALWREYRQALAADIPSSAIEMEAGAEDDVAKAETRSPDQKVGKSGAVAPVSGEARLSIVSAGDADSSGSGEAKANEAALEELRAQLSVAQESLESSQVEKDELKKEVKKLEAQITKMQSLMNIQSSELAKIQSLGKPGVDGLEPSKKQPEVAGADAAQTTAPEAEPAEQAMSEEDAMKALDELSDTEAIDALNQLSEATAPEAEVETGAGAEAETEAEAVTETEAAEEVLVEPEAEAEPALEVPPEEVEFMDTTAVEQQEPGLIDALLNNKIIIAAVLVLLLIVAAGGYVMFKQFRSRGLTKDEAQLRMDSAIDDLPLDMLDDDLPSDEAVARAAAEDGFDSDSTMVMSAQDTTVQKSSSAQDTVVTSAAPAAKKATAKTANAEPEIRDDIIAEADVYLAYGIYQQAEELLEHAVEEHPDKDAYRVKLAETYFASKNAKGMEALGVSTQKHVGVNDTPAWQKIIAMGLELCPDAEVFKNAGSQAADLDMDDIAPKSPAPMDFDLGDSDTGNDDLDFDFDAPAEPEPVADAGSSDLGDVEFDIGEVDAVTDAAEAPVTDDLADLDELELPDTSDDGGLDFDIGDLGGEEAADDAGDELAGLDLGGDDTGDDLAAGLDLDMDTGDDLAGLDLAGDLGGDDAADDLAGLDLGGDDTDEPSIEIDPTELDASTDLDMGDDVSELEAMSLSEPEELAPAPTPSVADTSSVDLSDIDVDEINTKLDLARAYLDMGDHEGARDILDEVISGGTPEQQNQAQELLTELA